MSLSFLSTRYVLCLTLLFMIWVSRYHDKRHFYIFFLLSFQHYKTLRVVFCVQNKHNSYARKVLQSSLKFPICLYAIAIKGQEFADICILMLCLSVLGARTTVQCAWSKHCTQRLGAGGHVQTHSAVERWQQQPSFVSSNRKENKGRKPLSLFNYSWIQCLLSHCAET